MVELMMLCVDCMKAVGWRHCSPSWRMAWRKRSVFWMHPRPVPLMMASGSSRSASRRVRRERTTARRSRVQRRRATSGGMCSEKLGSRLRTAATSRCRMGLSNQSSVRGVWAEICRAERIYIGIGMSGGSQRIVRRSQTAERTSAESLPPKPKELERMWRTGRVGCGSVRGRKLCSGMGVRKWRLTGRN